MNATLCALTLLVVASALRRMALYQDAYGYTTLRINADLFEIWLGLVVLAVLVSLFTPTRRWLGRTGLVAAAVLTIVGTVGNTNAWVADRNIERWQATGKIDTWYLSSLPADAVPTIESSALPAHIKQCALSMHQVYGAGDEDTLAGWNLARSRAEDSRVQVRGIRGKAKKELEAIKKDGEAGEDEVGRAEKDLDKTTGQYVAQIDELVKHKEGELLEV